MIHSMSLEMKRTDYRSHLEKLSIGGPSKFPYEGVQQIMKIDHWIFHHRPMTLTEQRKRPVR